jgi:hypothetical protein
VLCSFDFRRLLFNSLSARKAGRDSTRGFLLNALMPERWNFGRIVYDLIASPERRSAAPAAAQAVFSSSDNNLGITATAMSESAATNRSPEFENHVTITLQALQQLQQQVSVGFERLTTDLSQFVREAVHEEIQRSQTGSARVSGQCAHLWMRQQFACHKHLCEHC